MRTPFLAVVAFMLSMIAAPALGQVSFDVRTGTPPPPPRAFRVPPRPGPDFVWVEGYWWPQRGRYVWHDGYWTRPPYQGAFWVAPYWQNGRYFAGRWEGGRGDVFHDHRWDRQSRRDERRAPQRHRGRK